MPTPNSKPVPPLSPDAIRTELRKLREIAEMNSRRLAALEQARAESPAPEAPATNLHAGLTRERPARAADHVQGQILRELRKQNKRAGFSWVRVFALFLVISIILIALAA